MLKFTVEECTQKFGERLIAIRKQVHENPELGNQEFKTTALIKEILGGAPFEEVDLGLPTGGVFLLRGGKPGKTVGLRGDIDALPVTEDAGNPIRSQCDGLMHACGHDVHTTALLGAALLLGEHQAEIEGNIVFVFQHAEEPINGAQDMIDAGLFRLAPMDCMLGCHVKPEIPRGMIGVRSGATFSAKDAFKIVVTGRGGHGAQPQNSRDPIVAGAAIVSALQTVCSRSNSPLDVGVLSVCSIHAGTADNIIPDTLEMLGSMRTCSKEQRQLFKDRILSICKGMAEVHDCKVDVEFTSGVPVIYNDEKLTKLCEEAVFDMLGEDKLFVPKFEMFSDDFSLFGEQVPACYFNIGVAEEGKTQYPLHNAHFFPGEDAPIMGAVYFANAALHVLRSL